MKTLDIAEERVRAMAELKELRLAHGRALLSMSVLRRNRHC
jgi:hypothetical protein